MATGVPNKRGTQNIRPACLVPSQSEQQTLSLIYPGKKSTADIFNSKAGNYQCLWRGNDNPKNRLYFGDNLAVLAHLVSDATICGNINLVYIDPPFSTQTSFHSRKLNPAFEDTLQGGEFIEYLRERLVFIHRLLSDQGSLYLHLDGKMVFHLKVILDEIFGPEIPVADRRDSLSPKNSFTLGNPLLNRALNLV